MNLKLLIVVFVTVFFVMPLESCKNNKHFNEVAKIQHAMKKDSLVIDKSNLGKDDILSWNNDEALEKLGNPVSDDSFRIKGLPEFRAELYNYLPADTNIIVKELTWRTDSIMNLTIWYTQKNYLWAPVHFIRWHKDAEF